MEIAAGIGIRRHVPRLQQVVARIRKFRNYFIFDDIYSWCREGGSIKEIQELAGHKTITMSARYSHLSPEHRLSVIDRIATVS
jgi:integrase